MADADGAAATEGRGARLVDGAGAAGAEGVAHAATKSEHTTGACRRMRVGYQVTDAAIRYAPIPYARFSRRGTRSYVHDASAFVAAEIDGIDTPSLVDAIARVTYPIARFATDASSGASHPCPTPFAIAYATRDVPDVSTYVGRFTSVVHAPSGR